MNAIKITQSLNKALVDYLVTTFDANKDGKEPELAEKIRESFEYPKALFTGPFLELIYPYKPAASIKELCERGTLSEKLLSIPCFSLPKPEPLPLDAPLYAHQEKAIKKLCTEKRSIVISSGTGSGKTECFSIPIANDLLVDPTPGVRALLVYPLNALVNDQMERLRVMLRGTSITFGRFTSELPDRAERNERTLPNEIISREEIRKEGRIPQILITNYAMLEYLLLRPEDSILFNTGLWKFLVLDEAHTYTGAQGIEVSMLLRRLKQRLGKKPGDMICIATSATLVNDNPGLAADFAKKLFSEDLIDDDVIFGDEEQSYFENVNDSKKSFPENLYLHPDFDVLLEEIRKIDLINDDNENEGPDVETTALRLNEIGLIDSSDLALAESFQHDLPGFLFEVFCDNPSLLKLRNWMIQKDMPVLFEEAAKYIFPSFDQEDQFKALYHLIEICSIARPSENKLSLLPAKYHIFARPPQGMWACLNPKCSGKDQKIETKWSHLFSNPTNSCEFCGAKVYPIYLCRECGQVFIASHYNSVTSEFTPATDQLPEGWEKRYFTWSQIKENTVLADQNEGESEEEEDQNALSDQGKFKQNEITICLKCGKPSRQCNCEVRLFSIPLFDIQERKIQARRGQTVEQLSPIKELSECPRCRSKAKNNTEIVTPITIRGTGPLANLTYELYRQLPSAIEPKIRLLPGEGRKLLTFYDSRQGAARFAAFLQDISTRQNYRHIIPQAVNLSLKEDENGFNSAPNLFSLGKKSAELAWQKKILQSDPDSDSFWRDYTSVFTNDQRREAALWMERIILGEFTTGRRSRQSLESMGLIGVNYFSADSLPDFTLLSSKIGLNINQVQVLVGFLLDDLRFRKAVKLPGGIQADDPEFGPNKGNPKIIRQGKPNNGEEAWVGATERQYRRKFVQRVLVCNNLDSSEDNVKNVLNVIWDWLIKDVPGLMVGSASDGYQLDPRYLYFDTSQQWYRCRNCQRLSYRGDSLPCPYPNCGGEFEPVEINMIQKQNYYFNLFTQPLIPIRVEEHTAQLDSEKGKEYQDFFKKGYINVLSCSTTFEMGIDLGDLQAVVMSNVPPTVANYKQRAGRAGRRTSGTAFILTWASDRPHDQAYYDNPIEIISGKVAVPNIHLENEMIIRRHVNALLLSSFLRYRNQKGIETRRLNLTGDFFDNHLSEEPHYKFLRKWVDEDADETHRHLKEFGVSLPPSAQPLIETGIENFLTDLNQLNNEHYQPITDYYRRQISELSEKSADLSLSSRERKEVTDKQNYFGILLDRMRGTQGKNTGYLITYLSNNGILPSYSFPLHTVELILPYEIKKDEHLRLERDLRQAIIEYAPESEIVADKKVWRSKRPIFWKDTPKISDYRICEHCHHLEIGIDAGVPLDPSTADCPVCFTPYGNRSRIRRFVEPDGFLADSKSGKPAKQFINIEPNQMRSALIPEQNLDEEKFNQFVYISYNQKGKLLYVNEGKFGMGFTFPTQGFSLLAESEHLDRLSLGYIQTTNTLHIRFIGNGLIPIPSSENQSFWLSLLYAIIHGASHCLQIERRDIDGVLFPRSSGGSWEQTIVLYDNVPGGAGHVKNIRENLVAVLEEARRILNCNDCAPDTSCTHCLRDYNNQFFYQYLKREPAQKFLDLLIASLKPLDIGVPGAVRIVTSDPANWLLEKIRYANQSVAIAIPKLDLRHPMGENYTWLDTLGDLLKKRCEVSLYLQYLPEHTPEGYSLAAHLQVLMSKGLKVWKIGQLPEWQVIVDHNYSEARIIRSESEHNIIVLEDQIGTTQLLSSTNHEAVTKITSDWNNLHKTPVNEVDLNPPQYVKVINIRAAARSEINEQILFASFFAKPCKKMLVHDPYLFDREHIVNRLGKYISMASQHNIMDEVIIHTKKALDSREQEKAEQELISKFNSSIRFKHTAEHDRYIEITRLNGEQARIILGRGLDFIQPDGSVKSTYIVIEDPWKG